MEKGWYDVGKKGELLRKRTTGTGGARKNRRLLFVPPSAHKGPGQLLIGFSASVTSANHPPQMVTGGPLSLCPGVSPSPTMPTQVGGGSAECPAEWTSAGRCGQQVGRAGGRLLGGQQEPCSDMQLAGGTATPANALLTASFPSGLAQLMPLC
ncbi:hypothetical protein CHU98_g8542 [Xylaria longipes]|nr:hypothetical protein CHU98_g8542 [Xylaria longipes]